ncbi:MAG: N-6 DNA methylase [Gemmatales bacterium]|nr:N-6 DNA methylase [Gemmatales bacterium]MDW7994422.1 N-6 DNA methylase [Gemmatales bacterium]
MPPSNHEITRWCREYVRQLRDVWQRTQATDEQSLHVVLQQMLDRAASWLAQGLTITHEPRPTRHGRPDFIVTANDLPIGYVEAEAVDVDLDHLQGQAKEQNERFIANLDNFLLTNFCDFRLYREGRKVHHARLPKVSENRAPTSDEAQDLFDLLHTFFTWSGLVTATARDLAVHLARRTRQLRQATLLALQSGSSELSETRDAFREVLLPDLDDTQFADLFAQTVAYGLFAARCELAGQQGSFTRSHAANLIPRSNPFLRQLFQRLAGHDLDDHIAWLADDIAQLLQRADLGAILQDFGRRFNREDPVVHFYESFLAQYDPELREVRGVYYTPDPVVHYIVQSVDNLLKRHFDLPEGLADSRALVLDPACGTGTFLSWLVRLVQQQVEQRKGKGAWPAYVRERLLPRLFGFELLVAPYAVAHLKLALQLRESGFQFAPNERLGIYLTNSLEEAIPKSRLLFGQFISAEANEAVAVKRDKPVLVVLATIPLLLGAAS